jgi:hypothetical protein
MSGEQKIGNTYHVLSAGMTTIMPNGNVIAFGGPVRKGEGFTSVGQGTYTTADPDEQAWLDGLCKMKTPQVWKEELKEETVMEVPAAVASGVVAETVAVVGEIVDKTATSAVADAKSGGGDAAAAAAALLAAQ